MNSAILSSASPENVVYILYPITTVTKDDTV